MSDTQADKDTSNAGGTDNGTAAGAAGADNGQKALQFNADQVLWVNKHSDEMYGKGMGKAKAEFEPKLTAAETKVKELEDKVKALEAAGKGSKTDDKVTDDKGGSKKTVEPSEETKKLMAKVDELTQNMGKLLDQNKATEDALSKERENGRKSKVKDEFMTAASTLNFFDASDVFRLVENEIGFDEKHGVIVKNAQTGEPRMTVSGSSYRPVSLAEFLAEFAQKKPQYVKASTDGGSGAGGSRKIGNDSKEPDFEKMTLAEAAAFANKLQTAR